MGDCVEFHGYWSRTDSPPIYLESPGGYINKIACPTTNHPPINMARPSGSKTGYIGTSYSYAAFATDPDGNQVMYTFDWGDGTTSGGIGTNDKFTASAMNPNKIFMIPSIDPQGY